MNKQILEYQKSVEKQALAQAILFSSHCDIFVLTPSHFTIQNHRNIFAAILQCNEISQTAVRILLKDTADQTLMDHICSNVFSPNGFNEAIAAIENFYEQMTLYKISKETVSALEAGKIVAPNHVVSQIDHLQMGQTKSSMHSPTEAEDAYIADLEEKKRRKELGLTIGFQTHLSDYNRFIGPGMKGDLQIVAGRPGMGKTSYVLSRAYNHAKGDVNVAFFSLEMSVKKLRERLTAMLTGIEVIRLRSFNLSDEEFERVKEANRKITEANLYLDDEVAISPSKVKAKVKKLIREHGGDWIVIIDYMQLMTSDDKTAGNREQAISSISRDLKAMSGALDVLTIALSQLSRAVESRGGAKRPQLSDLRESGAIEQDGDLVEFCYRPEYYKIIEDDEGNSLQGVMEIIVAKNRNGATQTVKVFFDAPRFEVKDMHFWSDEYINQSIEKALQEDDFRKALTVDDVKEMEEESFNDQINF